MNVSLIGADYRPEYSRYLSLLEPSNHLCRAIERETRSPAAILGTLFRKRLGRCNSSAHNRPLLILTASLHAELAYAASLRESV